MIQRAQIVAVAFTAGQLFSCNQILGISERGLDPHLTCDDGGCICVADFGDCDGDPSNGCEADFSSVSSCGGCGRHCDNGQCEQGACACSNGFGDCNGLPADGCEAALDEDPRNCGACGHDCLGGACVSMQCQPTAVMSLGAYNRGVLVPHGGHVYVSSWLDRALGRVPAAGGPLEVLLESTARVGPLAIAAETVYWPAGVDLLSLPVAGGASPKTLVAQAKAYVTTGTAAFAVGGGYVYWQEQTPAKHPSLSRASLANGLIERGLWEGNSWYINQMVADGSNLYFCDGGTIFALAHGGSTAVSLIVSGLVGGFTVHGADVFFTDPNNEYISRISISGEDYTDLVASAGPGAIDADGEAVYWLSGTSVLRYELDSGKLETIATGQDLASMEFTPTLGRETIAVDDKAIYWSTQTQIMKLAK